MRLVITLPNRKPTPRDHAAIVAAVDSLRIGMGLRHPPPWSIESSASDALTTPEVAAKFSKSVDSIAYAARQLGVEPIDDKTRPRRWSPEVVEQLGRWFQDRGRERTKGGAS